MSAANSFPAASEVSRLAVIGAGTMGAGIAHVAALAGITVRLQDISGEGLEGAVSKVRDNLGRGVERGKVSADDASAALARITTTTSVEDAADGVDVVIEAVPEVLELKRSLFQTLARAAPARAVLATNTSSLPIADIASVCDGSRVIGMHFFNPVHIMKLVEVVWHAGTAPEVLECAKQLAERFGKTAIVVRDAPGFASSRLGLVLGLEAMRMVEQGVASASDIDTAMKLGYGHPMGPLELTDLVGLDVRLGIAEYLTGALGEHFRPPTILRDKVQAGKLGKKSGEGFYRWQDGKPTPA